MSFPEDALRENIGAFMNALVLAKPAGLKKNTPPPPLSPVATRLRIKSLNALVTDSFLAKVGPLSLSHVPALDVL
ncbi:hypothetical protein YC2023_019960 [Brassica napus]